MIVVNRRKTLTVSAGVVVLLIVSFFVGAFSSPYNGLMNGEMYGAFSGAVPSTLVKQAVVSETYSSGQPAQTQERMVTYNAWISLETSDIQGVLVKISALASNYGGYVTGSSHSTTGAQATAEINIRVPKDKFHSAVQEIEAYGKMVDEHTSSEDITQQYIDLNARLNNLQKQETRLNEILSIASTVDEILRVEDELTRVRSNIESLQGQINYLKGNVELSLVSVVLTEPALPFTPPGMNWGETFQTAILVLFRVVQGLIILAFAIVPLAIIGAPMYYLYKRKKRKETK